MNKLDLEVNTIWNRGQFLKKPWCDIFNTCVTYINLFAVSLWYVLQ